MSRVLNDLSALDKFIADKNGWQQPQEKIKHELWCLYSFNQVIFGPNSYKNCRAEQNKFKGVKGLSIKPYKSINNK